MPSCFVVMGFGVKTDFATGRAINFDRVYEQLLRPAVVAAGLSPIRASADGSGSSIHAGLYQQLLLADVVLADVTLHNANVFYELGIRHALRPRGTVLTMGQLKKLSDPLPFVLEEQPVQHYTLIGGRLDEGKLEEECNALTEAIRAVLDAQNNREANPVLTLLPSLQEPIDPDELRQALEVWRGRIREAEDK